MTATNAMTSGSADPKSSHSQRSTSREFRISSVFKIVFKLICVLITLVLYLAVVPVLLVITIPLFLYRGLVILLQKIVNPDWVGIMSSRDAIVGLDDTSKRCECMIIAPGVFRGDPDIKKCQEYFKKNVMEVKNSRGDYLYRKLTHYYENWLGFPFWKTDKDFQLENHVRLFDYKLNKSKAIDKDGKEVEYVTEDELLRSLGEIESLPFPKGRSPWEILILPNFIPKEGDLHKDYTIPDMTMLNSNPENMQTDKEKYFVLFYRVHHALGDGYSLLKMLVCNVCGESIDVVPKPPTRNSSFFMRIVNSIAVFIFTPFYHFKQFFVDVDRNIWHLPERRLMKKSHFVMTEKIPMESLKQIGKQFKVPLTGVFLAGLAGGIHNYLKLTGKGQLLPKCMRAMSPMPWENHPAFKDDGMVNHWTAGVFAIPVGKDSPQKRLKACKQSVSDLITSPILITNFFTIPILLSSPNFLTDIWGTNWMTTIISSNFPGPKTATKSFGTYPLDSVISFIPKMRGSVGIGAMFTTSVGNVRCTLSIDSAVLKDYSDAQFLISLIDEEFRILRSLHSPYGEDRV